LSAPEVTRAERIPTMEINENISFSALMGLILRANTDERLQIADDWLRANKQDGTDPRGAQDRD